MISQSRNNVEFYAGGEGGGGGAKDNIQQNAQKSETIAFLIKHFHEKDLMVVSKKTSIVTGYEHD